MATEKFTKFINIDGSKKKITLTRVENVSFGIVRKLRKSSEAEQVFGLLEACADENTLELLDQLSQGEVADILAEWQGVKNDKDDSDEEDSVSGE